jgi:hypothetical protein
MDEGKNGGHREKEGLIGGKSGRRKRKAEKGL